ncbi:rano class II histocompatibility antigen, A beta chain-like [Polymixia lowei]
MTESLPYVLLFIICFSLCVVDGRDYFMSADLWCEISSRVPEDAVYLIDWHFNQDLTMRYNSTRGQWTGLTPGGTITASWLNEDPDDVLQRKLELRLICINNVAAVVNATELNIAEPNVKLTSVKSDSSGQPDTLVCSAYDFYPKTIKLTWHTNGQEVTSDVTYSDVLSNGDWTYQVHSYLEYTPTWQETVTCVVEHASLTEPKYYRWAESQRSYLVSGSSLLLLGAVCLSVGLVRYRRKRLAGCVSQEPPDSGI